MIVNIMYVSYSTSSSNAFALHPQKQHINRLRQMGTKWLVHSVLKCRQHLKPCRFLYSKTWVGRCLWLMGLFIASSASKQVDLHCVWNGPLFPWRCLKRTGSQIQSDLRQISQLNTFEVTFPFSAKWITACRIVKKKKKKNANMCIVFDNWFF